MIATKPSPEVWLYEHYKSPKSSTEEQVCWDYHEDSHACSTYPCCLPQAEPKSPFPWYPEVESDPFFASLFQGRFHSGFTALNLLKIQMRCRCIAEYFLYLQINRIICTWVHRVSGESWLANIHYCFTACRLWLVNFDMYWALCRTLQTSSSTEFSLFPALHQFPPTPVRTSCSPNVAFLYKIWEKINLTLLISIVLCCCSPPVPLTSSEPVLTDVGAKQLRLTP